MVKVGERQDERTATPVLDTSTELLTSEAPSWSRLEIGWVTLLVVFVAAATSWRLGDASAWNDEASTWAISGHSLGDLLSALRSSGGDSGAALYYLVAHVWMSLFGTSEVALRSISVIAAAASVPPFHAIARQVVGRSNVWVADVLFAPSVFLLTYARDGRAYALALLLVLLASWAFLRATEVGTRRDWVTYTVLAILAVYAHWFAALVVAAQYLSLGALGRGAVTSRRALASASVVGLLTLPIALLVLFGRTSGVDWVAPLNVEEVRSVATTFTGNPTWRLQLVFLAVLIPGILVPFGELRRGGRNRDVQLKVLAAAWFFVPLAVVIVVSAFKPVLVDRYLIVALPGFVLVVALGLTRLARSRLALVLLTAIVVMLQTSHLGDIWNRDQKGEDWREIVRVVAVRSSPADAVVVYPASAVYAFSYYARDDPALRTRGGPTWPPVSWEKRFDRTQPAQSALAVLDRLHPKVVWLVVRDPTGSSIRPEVGHPAQLDALEQALAARFTDVVQLVPDEGHAAVVLIRYAQAK